MIVNDRTEGHIVRRYDGELASLRLLVLEMGGLVLDQVRRAVAALDREDLSEAREVIARDHAVNAYDLRVDEASIRLLARRQPVAGDLRVIMSIAKAVADLERIGDEAAKIARITLHLFAAGASVPRRALLRDVRAMATLATRMLADVLRAFDEMDVQAALAVAAGDAELDREFRAASRRLSTYVMEDSRQLGHTINALTAVKALERIGDHAKNIAEYIVYLVTGQDIRHADSERDGREV
jgi:phosphate transport system protein